MEHIFLIDEPDAAITHTAITTIDKTTIIIVVTIQGEFNFVEIYLYENEMLLKLLI